MPDARPPPSPLRPARRRSSRALTVLLNVTRACNFACDYCFAKEIRDYRTPASDGAGSRMTEETALRSVEWAFREASARGVRQVNLTYFGGEPLLAFDLVMVADEHARRCARQARARYVPIVVTNGSLLTEERIEWFRDRRFTVSISIDGDRAAHDRHRKLPSSAGTYDLLLENVLRATRRLEGTVAVCTLTEDSQILASYLHLEELGFAEMQVEIEHAFCASDRYARYEPILIQAERDVLLRIAERLAAGRPYMVYKPLADLLEVRRTGVSTEYPECGAGVDMVSVDVDGTVFPCACFIGLERFRMGEATRCTPLGDDLVHLSFRRATVSQRSTCSTCVARDACGGGCQFSALHKNGTILSPAADCGRRRALFLNSRRIFRDLVPAPPAART